MKFKVAAQGATQGDEPIVMGTLATVLIEILNGAEMSPKHYILLLFLPKES